MSTRPEEFQVGWVQGVHAGQVHSRLWPVHRVPPTAQNCVAWVTALCGGRQVDWNGLEWWPSEMLPAVLPAIAVERFSEFCPILVDDEVVAVLLRKRA